MNSYMEMIYIDDEDNARHTDIGASRDSNAATWAEFNSYRHLDVGKERAKFLLDYHNAKGDLADTICLDESGFTAITGKSPKRDSEYVRIDEDYWAAARTEAQPTQQPTEKASPHGQHSGEDE